MHLTMIAPGSRGDVQPYVALGKGLKEAGHFVRIVTHHNFNSLLQTHGIDSWPVDSDARALAESLELRETNKENPIALMLQMAKMAKRESIAFAQAGLAACRDTDMILAGIGGVFIASSISEKLRLPLLQAYVAPFTPTREFPSPLMPNIPSLLNKASHRFTFQLMWQGFRPADSLARQKVLHIPPAPRFDPFASGLTRSLPILYGYSPNLIPPPRDWNAQQHITGFWFLDEHDSWSPLQALTDFLGSGPPPVYIGFGSMSSRNPEASAELVLKALGQVNRRAILLSGWGGLKASDLPDSVFMIDSIPHSWLFPRVAAVVHHGGASTTAAGLRAGVPSVIIPFLGDQLFWGKRVAALGVGPPPIPRAKLTVDRLANAIQQAVTDNSMRERAGQLGETIGKEEGIGRAVQLIEQIKFRKDR